MSPPISLSRIINYDAERGEVTYWYRSHHTKGKKQKVTGSRETFIGRMVQHILPKGFHRIRYYGLQATCVLKKVRQKINVAFNAVVQLGMELLSKPVAKLSYQEKIKQSYDRDPFSCPNCGGEMYLWELWTPSTGFIDLTKTGYYRPFKPPPVSKGDSKTNESTEQLNQSSQLSLFTIDCLSGSW